MELWENRFWSSWFFQFLSLVETERIDIEFITHQLQQESHQQSRGQVSWLMDFFVLSYGGRDSADMVETDS